MRAVIAIWEATALWGEAASGLLTTTEFGAAQGVTLAC